ncbi:MAG: hypothetical protein PHC80_01440, partial [Eubacteriales bacterium]|nr:hypothetical protein [Eubacteriales bacterium]
HPDIETVHRMFGDAFDSEGKELYYPALAHFEQFVQEHFGMSVAAGLLQFPSYGPEGRGFESLRARQTKKLDFI